MVRLLAAAVAGALCVISFVSSASAVVPIPEPRPDYPPADSFKDRVACLAKAVYFEARGEPDAGQRMVASVILNRVLSPYYPDTVCEVVYQNKHLRNACQFSFACDGIPDVVSDTKAFRKAQQIAIESLSCGSKCHTFRRLLSSPTHYHADQVSPAWADKLLRTGKIGRHVFYYTSTM